MKEFCYYMFAQYRCGPRKMHQHLIYLQEKWADQGKEVGMKSSFSRRVCDLLKTLWAGEGGGIMAIDTSPRPGPPDSPINFDEREKT